MNEPRGVLMYFHGNNRGTADDLRRIEWPALLQALDLGLAVAVVAAPASRGTRTPADLFGYDMESSGTRVWETKPDSRLIHELLQSGFNSELAVDHDRVIFMGGSQGTCFLASFLEQYAAVYGGGFHDTCVGVEHERLPPFAVRARRFVDGRLLAVFVLRIEAGARRPTGPAAVRDGRGGAGGFPMSDKPRMDVPASSRTGSRPLRHPSDGGTGPVTAPARSQKRRSFPSTSFHSTPETSPRPCTGGREHWLNPRHRTERSSRFALPECCLGSRGPG